jgi:DNA polymerase-3 subunit alpha
MSGALDAAGGADRATMLASMDSAMKEAQVKGRRDPRQNYHSLFAALPEGSLPKLWAKAEPLPEERRLAAEKEYLGYYVTGHPHARFEQTVKALGVKSVSEVLKTRSPQNVRLFGTVSGVKVRQDKNGHDFAFASIEDSTSKIEIIIWWRTLKKVRNLLDSGRLLVAEGRAEPGNGDSRFGNAKVTVEDLWDLEEDLDSRVKSVEAKLPLARAPEIADFLSGQEQPPRDGFTPRFFLRIHDGSGVGTYELAKPPRLTRQLLDGGVKILGSGSFRLHDVPDPFHQ